MTAPHDKLSGIRPGDRVRVTFEGEYSPDDEFSVKLPGPRWAFFAEETVKAGSFQIERIEPPLKADVNVVLKENRGGAIGRTIAVWADCAWVQWPFKPTPGTHLISDLERIA